MGLLEIKAFIKSVSDMQYADAILVSWVDNRTSDCCSWERIKCNATTGRVMELSLGDAIRVNSVDASDGFPIINMSLFVPFQELHVLDLWNNRFEGWDENKASNTHGISKRLKILNIGYNSFNDSLVPLLTSLTSLTTLLLRANGLKEGFKPKKGLANLRNLEVLDVSGNGLTGSLTMQGICELKNLVELNLSGNKFDGSLPQCLSNLTYLRVLDLSSNQLSGSLPISVFANLTSLEYLSLSDNKFQGSFSLSVLANHSRLEVLQISRLQIETENFPWPPKFQLKVLNLQHCNVSGTIPSFLQYQYDLRYIDLSHNNLAGTIPTWLLQNNTKLEILFLFNNFLTGRLHLPDSKRDLLHLVISNNNFIGTLPDNFGVILPELVYLDMSQNSFVGSIPPSTGYMERLLFLDLSSNNFSGELPKQFLTGCVSLEFMNLSHNLFVGQIFPKYMNLTQLAWLYLSDNQFTGRLEEGLLNAPSLYILDVSNNMLSGQLPHWAGNFSNLDVLLMSRNSLEGDVSVPLSNLQVTRILDISGNKLYGPLEFSSNHSSLRHLFLHNNSLNGTIPNALLQSSQLTTLDLRDNEFSGNIPHLINEDSNLRALLLRGNNLQGNIPEPLCHLRKLSIVDISCNNLNGSIPSCFTNISLWMEEGDSFNGFVIWHGILVPFPSMGNYYNSILSLMLPGEDYRESSERVEIKFMAKNRYESYKGDVLNYMTGLDLSSNELTGDIPSEIGLLQELHALNLSHNHFSGSIPRNFSNLKMIESMDLSYNELSGRIPLELSELNYLAIFNVSYNDLLGPVPNSRQFANFDENNYRGNPLLCGPPVLKNCSSDLPPPLPTTPAEEDESAIDKVAFNWSFAASYVAVILGLMAILLLNSYWRRQWFLLVDACIDSSCFYFLYKLAFYRRRLGQS
ncbi:receptor-like protein 15 [Citrus sinensis]|uniref:LRR receptor-like serine/threonine-protein kinase FLS2 n=1 Tax=Citrus clementina TaxID=85681 RepID=UPI000CED5335|nr:LRR receptor-like serine/threonine-protein kinase FLS2 [Citrus x clementina]XP_052287249.1 receptor-like protein 15 [Citrus sinensis]